MNKTFHQRGIQTDDYSYITNLNLVASYLSVSWSFFTNPSLENLSKTMTIIKYSE